MDKANGIHVSLNLECKNRLKKIRILSSFIFFLVTLFTSYSLGEIFYNSIDGTDFYRYFKYIEYFRGDIESPSENKVFSIFGLLHC